MDFQTTSAILFVVLLGVFLYARRDRLRLQKIFFPVLYVLMYRSKVGLKAMDSWASRLPKLLKWLATAGIFIGFLGMALIAFALVQNLVKLLTNPTALPGVQLVLPVKVPGTFYVPFFYWIISIMIIAAVHEFSHGLIARAYKMKIKSSGIAFLGIIIPILPAAFVEPDEKEVSKRKVKQQLSVFAAGPFSNIILGAIALLLLFAFAGPITGALYQYNGVQVTGFINSTAKFPAETSGIKPGEIVTGLDNNSITDIESFVQALKMKTPGENLHITTNKTGYDMILAANPSNLSAPYLGIFVRQNSILKPGVQNSIGGFLPEAIVWLLGLLYWLYLLSVGIGLFNLLPLGPVDGGRMMLTTLEKYFDQKKARFYWMLISAFFITLILVNVFFGFTR
ncbi:MAG: site-2 protease family protein [Candidatus Woesearchaeota archaeon]